MKILRRIRYLFRQRQMERELAEEIEFHRAISGQPREMGNLTQAREDARAVWIWPWLQSIFQDVSYAFRGFRREPGFAFMSLLALGTAIGLNASLFTIFNSIALRSWPVKDPSLVVRIFTRSPRPTNGVYGLTGVSIAEFRYLAAHTKALSGIAAMSQRRIYFGFEPFGKGSLAVLVAADHFKVFGADLHMGRGFLPEEDITSAPQAVMVLNYAVWRDHFGSDPGILGRRIPVNDVPFTVVGVAAESFNLSGNREGAWMPLPSVQLLFSNDPSQRDWLSSPSACCEPIAGRLARGATREQARAELEVLSTQFRSSFPDAGRAVFLLTDPKILEGDPEASPVMRIFGAIFLGVTLIVLLACANVGNLLVARAAARQREIEVRRAVGAGRGRIVRQLLTESLVLALGAGGIGVLIAYRFPAFALSRWLDDELPSFPLTPDATVLAYAIGLALFACLCFGLAPALHGTHPRPMRSRLKLRSWLLASQVALSAILLTAAGLMLEGVRRAAHKDLGFAVQNVSVTGFELPASVLNRITINGFAASLQHELPGATGLEHFALVVRAPLEGNWSTAYRLPQETREQLKRIDYREISPGYFETLGIPLVAGRDFGPGDAGRPVIIVNETVARHWENGNPIGKTLVVAGTPREVIGVAKNTYTADLNQIGPLLYQPLTGFDTPKVIFRSGMPEAAQAIEAAARRIQPGARTQTVPLSKYVDQRLGASRVGAKIAGLLGVFALALATVGMFGVFAYAVQQRTKEIGIRMALGAKPAQVVRAVIATSSRAIAAGFAMGLLAAMGGSRLIAQYLYGVNPLDPRTYLLVASILAGAALAASYLPARRAARIDPLTALRHE
jgi:predicted permease